MGLDEKIIQAGLFN